MRYHRFGLFAAMILAASCAGGLLIVHPAAGDGGSGGADSTSATSTASTGNGGGVCACPVGPEAAANVNGFLGNVQGYGVTILDHPSNGILDITLPSDRFVLQVTPEITPNPMAGTYVVASWWVQSPGVARIFTSDENGSQDYEFAVTAQALP